MAAPSLSSTSTTLITLLTLLLLRLSIAAAHGGHSHSDSDTDADADNRDPREKGLILVKIWCLIIMFASTFAGGISPYFYRWNESFLLLGTQFAGGVFLGTALMHFLSDSTETFGELTPDKEYPFSFMLAAAGYLLTMLGDCVIAWLLKDLPPPAKERVEGLEDGGGGGAGFSAEVTTYFVKTASLGDTVLLILALCFHSVFEGIAVGVSGNKAEAWRNMWTISLHKIFAAVAMGIALLKMIPQRPLVTTAIYSFVFAISSPIGIGIGIALDATTQGPAADWTYAIAMGLTCGVFIYVAINHLIAKGYRLQVECYYDYSFYKYFAVLLGVAVIAIVMIWD
ncbi:zinc transporter 1-like [Andrographis paniculata]|uniref:zinc transporter 1-like n=1 Tax=Andrographis paniculata TaxID=175694 RepID=UPI0021E7E4EE|nr:zinc transporter 1-like [Andrographis paniculata]